MNVLQCVRRYDRSERRGASPVLVTEPSHPYVGPGGHRVTSRIRHAFTHRSATWTAIAEDRDPKPSFADGLAVQRVLGAWKRAPAKNMSGQRSRDDRIRNHERPVQHRVVHRRRGIRRLRRAVCPPSTPWERCQTGRGGANQLAIDGLLAWLTATQLLMERSTLHDDHAVHGSLGRPAVHRGVPARVDGATTGWNRLLGDHFQVDKARRRLVLAGS